MFSFPKFSLQLPDLRSFPLKHHDFNFSLGKLVTGVDNVRFDVSLSPRVCKTTGDIAYRLLAEHSRTEEILGIDNVKGTRERQEFGELCKELLLDGINKAKTGRQIQIDFLAQIAIAKMLTREIQSQYEVLLQRFKNNVWKNETAKGQHHASTIALKDKLSELQQNRKRLFQEVGANLFQYFTRIQQRDLQEMREANFGVESLLPDDIFSNPMIHVGDTSETSFLLEKYNILFGNRLEDPDKYDALVALLKRLLNDIDSEHPATDSSSTPSDMDTAAHEGMPANHLPGEYDQELNSLLMCPENIQILLNCFETNNQIKRLKNQGAPKKELSEQKSLAAKQTKLLRFFYNNFKASKLPRRFAAFYEMQSVYQEYCPPLIPQQVLQFLITPGVRKEIIRKLNRLKEFYGKSFSVKPLRKLIKDLKRISREESQKYLIRYLDSFSRYHRDRHSFTILWKNMEKINQTSDEKVINLSRANNSLYEFLLPDGNKPEAEAVLNHVIIKADVRGSTDITYQMKERGLNPASYFSLNFFDPITVLLEEYGARKVFIEGDAIILTILEHEDSPGEWYAVARACGLAINMLNIIRRYNLKNKENHLPILELGIGIVFREGPPTVLFDGDNRIMISPAINLADRLSGCTRSVRRQLSGSKKAFNLYVYQTTPEEDMTATADDLFLRYNVNGIELNEAGFEKLSKEIKLKASTRNMRDLHEEEIKIFTGKYPTTSGDYRRLIIRESPVPEVESDSLQLKRLTDRTFYEVSTNPELYSRAD